MKTVLIQVGHWNAEKIGRLGLRSWRNVTALQKSTGGAGERDFYWSKVMPRLRDKLIAAGVQVHITDATYQSHIYTRNYDLMVSLHDDGAGTENRCMAAAPLRGATPPYLTPQAQALAEKFVAIWKRVYPAKTGAIWRDSRVTAGMREYYAWDYVNVDTPCAVLEHCNRDSAKGKELRANPELIAEADFQAIKEFLGLIDAPAPTADKEKLQKVRQILDSTTRTDPQKVADIRWVVRA